MKNKLLRELSIGSDGDCWGWAMGCFFAIADEMYFRGLDLPYSWQYSPGASQDAREHNGYEFNFCQGANDSELLQAGLILERYTKYLKYKGEDY